ncbi:MAG: ABC transporter substrate-binding protein [Armatimonadetes bacterium]|nr:ABC transporter substrate-binding protein [Armatimonadota bacterium]
MVPEGNGAKTGANHPHLTSPLKGEGLSSHPHLTSMPLCLFLAVVVVFSLSFFSIGCKPGGARSSDTVLRISGWTSSPAEETLLMECIKEFAEKHPNLDVRYEPITGDYFPKIVIQLASGTAPDVFYLDSKVAQYLMAKGVLLPMDPFLKGSPEMAEFIPSLERAFSWNGLVYGIPKDFNTYALYYNKRIFDEAGIPYPNGTWSWEQLRETAKGLTDTRDRRRLRYGLSLAEDLPHWLPFALQNRARILNPEGTACVLNSSQAVEALTFYGDLKLKDQSACLPSEVGGNWPGDAFAKGYSAMVLEGAWLELYVKKSFPSLSYGVCEIPKGPKGDRANLVFTVAYVIPKKSKHPRDAWDLIRHLTSLDIQKKILHSGMALPSRSALQKDPYFLEHPTSMAHMAGASYGQPYQFGPGGRKMDDIMGAAVQEVFLSVKSPQQALDDAVSQINRWLLP